MLSAFACWVVNTVWPVPSRSIVCCWFAFAASTNFVPESIIRESGSAVPRNIVPSSETAVESWLRSSELTSPSRLISRSSVDSGRLAAPPLNVSPAAA
jgi:hypothetical protein